MLRKCNVTVVYNDKVPIRELEEYFRTDVYSPRARVLWNKGSP